MQTRHWLLILATLLLGAPLTSCGGGGGGGGSSNSVSATLSTVFVAPVGTIPADGTSTVQFTVTALDGSSNPLQGRTVTIAASGTGNIITQPASTTNANGVAIASLASTVPEVKTITVTVGSVTLNTQPIVTFTQQVDFDRDPAVYSIGVPIAANAPSIVAPNGFTVNPALPAGLALDATTGVISGTPTAITATADYTITADFGANQVMVPVTITITEASKILYTGHPMDHTIGMYLIEPVSGSLQAVGTVAAPPGEVSPRQLTVHPNGQYLYVPNFTSDNISHYVIDPTTGNLSAQAPASGGGTGMGATEMVIDPTGAFAFVLFRNSDEVVSYDINPGTGSMTPIAANPSVPTGTNPESLDLAVGGQFVIVVNGTDSTVQSYSVDGSTGELTAVAGTVSTGIAPNSLVVPEGVDFAYAADTGSSSITIIAIDPSTGALSAAGSQSLGGGAPLKLAADPTGQFLFAADLTMDRVHAFRIDAATGALTPAGGPIAAGDQPAGITVDPTGTILYVSNRVTSDVTIFSIDGSTGILTQTGAQRVGRDPFYMAVGTGSAGPGTRVGSFAYSVNRTSDDVNVYQINPTTGVLTELAPPATVGQDPDSITSDPFGRFLYVTNATDNTVSGFAINPSTGALTPVPGSPFATGNTPRQAGIDLTARYLYVANESDGTVSIFDINPTTGALTVNAGSPATAGTNPISLVLEPTGGYCYVGNAGTGGNPASRSISAYRVNSDGSLTGQNPVQTGVGEPNDMCVHPDGRFLYLTARNTNLIGQFSIDPSDGSVVGITGALAGVEPSAFCLAPSGLFAYVTNRDSLSGVGSVSWYPVDPISGELVIPQNVVMGGTMPTGLAISPDGAFLYTCNEGSDDVDRFDLDATTGQPTFATMTGAGLDPADFHIISYVQ